MIRTCFSVFLSLEKRNSLSGSISDPEEIDLRAVHSVGLSYGVHTQLKQNKLHIRVHDPRIFKR